MQYRVLEFGPTGVTEFTEDEDYDHVAPPPEGYLRWIDLEDQDEAQLAVLAERFGFHPLAIEDCLHFDQRPKLEHYDGYLFLVMHGFELISEPEEELRSLELHTFLGDRYLITVHTEPLPPLNSVWNRLKANGAMARRGPDFIRYLVADATIDTFFPLMDHLTAEIEEIEDALLGHSPQPSTLESILRLKRLLVTLRKVLSPQRDVLARLARPGEEYVADKTALYFRDVYDHLLRISESVEANRELLASVLDAYLWSASQRTSEIMKRLTVLSAIFLPLTFITGFFGQNFERMPFGSNWLFAAMLASCAVVPAGMLFFFLRSKWF